MNYILCESKGGWKFSLCFDEETRERIENIRLQQIIAEDTTTDKTDYGNGLAICVTQEELINDYLKLHRAKRRNS